MTSSAKIPLRQKPSLVITPELMQSIQLLQMARFELNQFITLEVGEEPAAPISVERRRERRRVAKLLIAGGCRRSPILGRTTFPKN